MKKLFMLLFAIVMVLSMVACGEISALDTQKKPDTLKEGAENDSSDNISISSVTEKDDEEADNIVESADEQEEKENTESTDSIRTDFKETMDKYEAFFDEYVEFMKKYNNSEDTVSMLTDYLNIMRQYTDTMESLSEINESELTTAEALYYAEVMTRINAKMLEAVE